MIEYEISGRGTDSQTLHVYDPSGSEIDNSTVPETRSGWLGDEARQVAVSAVREEVVGAIPSMGKQEQEMLLDLAAGDIEGRNI